MDNIHIDRLEALYSAPGYREAAKLFDELFFGGAPAGHAFERAMLMFFEAGRKKDMSSAGAALFNCFASSDPNEQVKKLGTLSTAEIRDPLPNQAMRGFSASREAFNAQECNED